MATTPQSLLTIPVPTKGSTAPAIPLGNTPGINLQGGNINLQGDDTLNQQGSSNMGNILQPAAPTPVPVPSTRPATVPVAAPITVPTQPQPTQPTQPAQTFMLGNGKSYDINGNEITAPAAPDINQQMADAAGKAGMSVTDYLTLLGSQAATNSQQYNTIRNNLGIPAAQDAAFALPSTSTVDFYNNLYSQSGLADMKQKIIDLDQQIATANQQYTDAVGKENENPFLSEASRVGRTANLYNTAQSTIANLLNQQTNLQGIYANSVSELNNAVTRHSNDFTTNTAQNQAKLTNLLAQAEKQVGFEQTGRTQSLISRYMPEFLQSTAAAKTPSTITAPNGETLQYNKTTGKWEALTPPVGSYTPFTDISGQTGILNQQTGATSLGGPAGTPLTLGSPSSLGGAPTLVIPQYVNGQSNPQFAYVNNNPGNLKFANQQGATQGTGGFAQFATPQDGFQALVNQVNLDSSRGLTLAQYISKYAPPSENNTSQYLQQAMTSLGVAANTPLNQIDPQKMAIFQAMKESGTQVTAAQGLQVALQPNNQASILPAIVEKYTETLPNIPGSRYINQDRVAASQLNAVQSQAAGKVPVLNTAEVTGLKSIDVIFKNLTDLNDLSSQLLSTGLAGRLNGLTGNQLTAALQTDPRFANFQLARDTAIKTVQALAGGAGSGLKLNLGEIETAANNLPNITDNLGYAQEKITGLRTMLTNQLNETLPNLTAGQSIDLSDLNFSLQ